MIYVTPPPPLLFSLSLSLSLSLCLFLTHMVISNIVSVVINQFLNIHSSNRKTQFRFHKAD